MQMRIMGASDGSIYWLKQASRRAVEIDGEVGIVGSLLMMCMVFQSASRST